MEWIPIVVIAVLAVSYTHLLIVGCLSTSSVDSFADC